MSELPTLEYRGPTARGPGTSAVAFWSVYAAGVLVWLLVDRALFGFPRDADALVLGVSSSLVVTMLAAVLYVVRLRQCGPAAGLAVAVSLGLCSTIPAYAVGAFV